jgi:hypothetical protein
MFLYVLGLAVSRSSLLLLFVVFLVIFLHAVVVRLKKPYG